MNPILLARHVQDSLRELVHTTLNSTSRAFEGMVERFIAEPGNFIKGPWISVDMPFRQIDGAADGTWVQPFPEVPLRFAPYPAPDGRLRPAGREGDALDPRGHRDRIGQDGVLPLADPRPLSAEQGKARDQGDPDLPDERAGD